MAIKADNEALTTLLNADESQVREWFDEQDLDLIHECACGHTTSSTDQLGEAVQAVFGDARAQEISEWVCGLSRRFGWMDEVRSIPEEGLYFCQHCGQAERDVLGFLERQREEAIHLFSNPMKPERERAVCAVFLRCLGVAFQDHEIVSSLSDPPDVLFGSAAFEVREILDPERKRGKEVQEELERIRCARSVAELFEPYHPDSVPWAKVLSLVQDALAEKSAHYAPAVRAKLDALFYVNLMDKSLDGRSLLPDAQALAGQGWRSVSVLFPLCACVLWASDEAPDFLRNLVSRIRSEWRDLDSLWELPPAPPQ